MSLWHLQTKLPENRFSGVTRFSDIQSKLNSDHLWEKLWTLNKSRLFTEFCRPFFRPFDSAALGGGTSRPTIVTLLDIIAPWSENQKRHINTKCVTKFGDGKWGGCFTGASMELLIRHFIRQNERFCVVIQRFASWYLVSLGSQQTACNLLSSVRTARSHDYGSKEIRIQNSSWIVLWSTSLFESHDIKKLVYTII